MNRADRKKAEKEVKRFADKFGSMLGEKSCRELTEVELQEVKERLYEIQIEMIERILKCSNDEIMYQLVSNLHSNIGSMGEFALFTYTNDRFADFKNNCEQNLIKLRWMQIGE